MSNLQEIAAAIANLPPKDFVLLRGRIQQPSDEQWDAHFAQDVAAGRLDRLGEPALAEHRAGQSTPFPPDAQ